MTECFRFKAGLTAPDLISCYGMIFQVGKGSEKTGYSKILKNRQKSIIRDKKALDFGRKIIFMVSRFLPDGSKTTPKYTGEKIPGFIMGNHREWAPKAFLPLRYHACQQ